MGLLDWAQPIADVAENIINAFSINNANAQNVALQREEWAREDSAYQRKVADLEKAGLNKALALGGGASSSLSARIAPIQVDSPDVTTPIRMGIQRQQSARNDLELDALDAEVRAKKAEAGYQEKYWNYMASHADSIAEMDMQIKEFQRQAGSYAGSTAEAKLSGQLIANSLSDLAMRFETQLGAPGSGAQILRALLGGNAGILDIVKALR